MDAIDKNQSNEIVIKVVGSIANVDEKKWDGLTDGMPLLRHAFLSALERSGSIGNGTGWNPCTVIITQNDQLIGAMPLFIKSHSYGEYVFDWAWADAYQQNGLSYYPKLLSAIPFTPITSSRLLAKKKDIKLQLIEALEAVMYKHELSSVHVLFPDDSDASMFEGAGWLKRDGVQFRWQNEAYDNFEMFLSTLSHNKRKKIHQERKKVKEAGVECRYIKGDKATEEDWDFFYQCYCLTYDAHHSTPYLTRSFFTEISKSMPENILLIMAAIGSNNIACSLCFYNQDTLFGRYWGAIQFVSGLHFELCYYQAQQFCISEGIEYFEGGAQGEHKLARGFMPRPTCSFHKIAHPQFATAIKDFLGRESRGIASYNSELEERSPFKEN